MKVFNGKEAANEYMSSHTLAFSTPELTLMRFSFWLGDMVPDPKNKEEGIPRLLNYIEEKDFAPAEIIDEENYVPTGAVLGSGMYGSANSDDSSNAEQFCPECGGKNSSTAKFCRECGTNLI